MNETLRKCEMAGKVVELTGCPRAGGERALNAVLESPTDAVRERW